MGEEDFKKRIRQIDGWIKALKSEVQFLDERSYLLKPLVRDDDVKAAMKAKLEHTAGVVLWNNLVPLLGQDYIRELARLFLDRGANTGSLTNVWRKLQAPGVRGHYRDAFSRLFSSLDVERLDGSSEMPIEQRRENKRAWKTAVFDQRWAAVSQAMLELADDGFAHGVKTFRDKRHAHFEMQRMEEEPVPFDVGELGLTYDGIFDFGFRCEQILVDLGELLTQTHWNLSGASRISAKRGRALWMTLAK